MDNRRLLIAMAVGLAAILIWLQFTAWLDHRMGWDRPVATTQPAATQPATRPGTEPGAPGEHALATTEPATSPAATTRPVMAAAIGGARFVPTTQPSPGPRQAAIGLADPKDGRFALQVKLDPNGAGFESVVLNSFTMTALKNSPPYTFEAPPVQQPDFVPFGTRGITVNQVAYDLMGLQWGLISKSVSRAVYGAELVDHGRTLLEIRKSFDVSARTDPDKGYEVRVGYTFKNLTDKPLSIQTAFNGPDMPPEETRSDREVVVGYQVDHSISFDDHHIEEFKPDKDDGQLKLITDSKNHPARWVGAVNNYFGVIVLPEKMRVDGKETGDFSYISSIVAQGVNLKADLSEDKTAYLTFATKDIKIGPNQSVTLPLSVYLGPKWRDVLETPHYTAYPRLYNLLLIVREKYCAFCTFTWLVNALVWLLTKLHFIVRDWGLAIIGLVAIVRVILHPITRQSQISMSKMTKMGPEMKRLQEKYKDDKEALNRAMIDFHKQQGVGPYLGCLPMFLQMPIWIALYGVLETTFELRHAPFLWGWTWIKDLSQPDYLVKFAHPLPLVFGMHLYGLALLPVLLAVVMLLQQQFMPKPAAATPEQQKQQAMMQWLSPIMFLLIFYTYPSGLNLYVFASTGVGVIESKIVRDHIRAKEEAERAGRVFVETKPTRGRKGKPMGPQEPAKKGGPIGWLAARWAKLLDQAEQARKNDKRGKK